MSIRIRPPLRPLLRPLILPCAAALVGGGLVPAAHAAAEGEQVAGFTEDENWQTWWPAKAGDKPYTVETRGGDLVLTVSPGATHTAINMLSRPVRERSLAGVERIGVSLDGEVAADTVMLALGLRDEEGETHVTEPLPIAPGGQTLTWDLPGQFAKSFPPDKNGQVDGTLRVDQVFVTYKAQQLEAPFTLRFEDMTLTRDADARAADAPAAKNVEIGLVNGGRDWIFTPEEYAAGAPKLRVHSPRAGGAEVAVTWGVFRDYVENPTLDQKSTVKLDADGTAEIDLPTDDAAPMGLHRVHWRVEGGETGGGEAGGGTFAVMELAGPTPGVDYGDPDDMFLFGHGNFNDTGGDDDALRRRLRAAAVTGGESVRTGLNWSRVEVEQGQYDWSHYDKIIGMIEELGMDYQCLLSYGGRAWTKSEAGRRLMEEQGVDPTQRWPTARFQPEPELWRTWVRAVATRYKGRIKFYEIWNEPDLGYFPGTADEYLVLLDIAHEEIKKADPDAKVLTGGFGSVKLGRSDKELIDRTLDEGRDDWDYLAYHRHGTFERLTDDVETYLQPAREKLGILDKPMWFNETALGRPDETSWDMAREMPKRVPYLWSYGTDAWYNFCIFINNQDSSGYDYSMLSPDYHPRPNLPAYTAVVRMLRGREFDRRLDFGEGFYGFAFRGKGTFTGQDAGSRAFVIWKQEVNLPDEVYAIRVPGATSAEVSDLMGNRRPVPVRDGVALVTAALDPIYLLAEGVTEGATLAAERLVSADLGPLPPGEAGTMRVTVTNPYAGAATFTATAQADPDAPIRLPDPEAQAEVPAGEAGTLEIPIALGADARVGDRHYVHVTVRTGEFEQTLAVPASAAAIIRAGPTEELGDGGPLFRVATEGGTAATDDAGPDVVNYFGADPANDYRNWAGPDDLSAQAWVGVDGGELVMQFDVRDDEHSSAQSDGKLFNGDSVQIAVVGEQRGDFGVALRDGKVVTEVYGGAKWFTPEKIEADVTRQGDVTRYVVRVSFNALTLNRRMLESGVPLSFIVNENDGEGRDGYIRLSDGIGGKKTSDKFPLVRLVG